MNRKRWKLPKKLDKQWNKPLVSEKRRAKNSTRYKRNQYANIKTRKNRAQEHKQHRMVYAITKLLEREKANKNKAGSKFFKFTSCFIVYYLHLINI